MITLRTGKDRGATSIGWLESKHSFSFGEYRAPLSDPFGFGFRTLRVLNDDIVAPGQGFGTHGHRDMEIISIVLSGALEHRDSLGHGAVLPPGEVQVMSAGSGIQHSEFNHSKTEPVHFLQVWILPDARGHAPGYGQRAFSAASRANRLVRVAGPAGNDEALPIHQDAHLFVTTLAPGATVRHAIAAGRAAYIHVAQGACTVNGQSLTTGDGAAIEEEKDVVVEGGGAGPSDVLVFDLA
ncbi:MAG: pirin family protein [Phycisphaerae bacterium]|nr:pirin family protein [Phycisphaerae bacterium]